MARSTDDCAAVSNEVNGFVCKQIMGVSGDEPTHRKYTGFVEDQTEADNSRYTLPHLYSLNNANEKSINM